MEPTVVSGPLGHTQWEPEQPFPLGFQTGNSDSGGVLSPSETGQVGLDFRKGAQDETLQKCVENPAALEDLFQVSAFSCENLKFEGQPSISQTNSYLQGLTFKENFEGLDEITDSTLSWLFSPALADVIEKSSASKELTLEPESPAENSDAPNDQGDLISLSASTSPLNISRRNSESNEGDQFLLVDLSDVLSGLSQDSSNELNPQVVAHELPEVQQADLPPSQSRKTLSPETRDKGLFPDQVTDLPITCSAAERGLSENCHAPDHISKPSEGFGGPVPLLDLEVPDFDGSLCPATPSSVVSPDLPNVLTGVSAEAPVFGPSPSEEQTQNESRALGLLDGPSFLTLPVDEDACVPNDLASESQSVENVSLDLMENQNFFDAKTQSDQKEMALDLCLTGEEVQEDLCNFQQQEAVKGDTILSTRAEERLVDTNPPELSEPNQVASFKPPVQDINSSSPEAGWMSKQTVEKIPPSEMVRDDSLPVVPAVNTRQEDASPLKAVFDALDQDGDGFVRIEEFMEFAAAYGADQVKDLTKFLDPSGLGVISFEDFHRGITAISNGGPEPPLYSYTPGDGAVGCPEEYDEQNEVTDSAYLGSESTYSECETFTDEDTGALVPPEMHEEVETDSGIEATLHDPEDGGSRFSLNSELHSHSVTVISGEEEHFEDFGESNTSELLLESSVEGSMVEGDSSLSQPPEQSNGSAVVSPSAPASLPDCFQSFLREEALDFFCSQCHKQISRLEDLSTRLNFLEMTSAGKRLSSKKVARHLLQNSSMTLDTMSDLTRDILELADNDITDKVLLLERRVAELEKESEASGEQHARLRQENLQLVHRANALEEQLKEQELQADEELQQETRRHKESLNKLEREKGLELENLQARLQQLDDENSELRSCVPCLRANIERLEEEKRKLQDEVETMSDRLDEETESRRKMADKLSHERHQNQKEKESTQELIEDLRKQLEHLQLYKLEAEAKRGRSLSAGLQEYQTRTREAELEQEIKRLKQDNRTLKEQNDELNGQIINLSIQGAKNLMSASFSDSLAAEINSVSRAELMEAVHKQEEINYRLQDYIDKIIVAIMESNPSILEVK
ncbi:rab11 family-interacting protein 3 [Cyprinodon tularosa]|uniref:rab11 family-interacting protein 3 n=1 Tax=Cyprinodon tularosa TaxID=77115 RepID=UPI0018E250E8|nr:rab11 family-interacting protein 3 [Cyprinodon tularosa]